MSWLINAAQANKFRKSQKSLIIMDATFHLPQSGRDAKQEFLEKHITGAQFFDIAALCDASNPLPYMALQNENEINEKLGALGIRNDYKIIFYDNSDLHSAARALWMMKYFGHNPQLLYIVDGGLAAWEKTIGKTESGPSSCKSKHYLSKLQPHTIRTLSQMKENLKTSQQQVVDLRHPARFAGGRESRSGLRSGHIPGSFSFPFSSFFETNGTFKPLDKIRTLLESVAIDVKSPTIAMCGSGITAANLDFVLDLLGNREHQVYDGSWTEWGSENFYPGEKNLEERPVETCIEEDFPEDIE